MKTTKFAKPQFVEGLTIRVKPEDTERYMQLEEEIWLEGLAATPGFLGGEVWVSADHPGEVTSLYFWESEEAFKAIDPAWLAGKKEETHKAMDSEFVRAWHGEDRRFKVKEYR